MKTLNLINPLRNTLILSALALAVAVGFGAGNAQAAPPANDNFADAIDLAGDSGIRTGLDNTIDATSEAGEPAFAYGDPNSDFGLSVWYKWTCPADGTFVFRTGGSKNTDDTEWDAYVSIYDGASLATLNELQSSDHGYAETVAQAVSADTTYYMRLTWGGAPTRDATNLHLEWSLIASNTVVDISNASHPVTPDDPGGPGINIDAEVGVVGNSGRLIGQTQTHWSSGGFSAPLDLNGNTLIINSGNGNTMNASGAISGDGVVRVEGGGSQPIRIQGSTGNTYTGTTIVTNGTASLEKSSGNALCGNITVGSTGTASLLWTAADQINDASDVALVQTGSLLDLAGFADTLGNLTLAAGTSVETGTGGVLTVNLLTVGGTPMAAGTYTSAESAFVTGSGSVVVLGAPPPSPPVNDNFADAIDLPGSTGTQTGTTTLNATIETGEPDCGATNTVWFKWTCTTTGNFTISTSGSTNLSAGEWDAILGIYTGASVDALTPLPGTPQNIGQPETMTVAVTAGNTYYIQAAGFENAVASNILLNWSWAAPPTGVAVGATGSAIQTFGTRPAATDWSTLTWTGTAAEITDIAGMDLAVQGLIASDISTQVGTAGSNPPSANEIARFNSTLLALQMRPTGVVKGCVLMATLANTSGGGINQLEISYDLGMPAAGVESVAGVRAYYSLTGLANSWTVIPEFCTATAGPQSTVVSLSSTWTNATTMYVLWVDDTTALTGNDMIYTMIDNVSFAKAGTGALITAFDFGLPAYGSAMIDGTNISINVPTGTDVLALMPTFTLSNGAICDKVSGGPTTYDFSGTSQTYTVTPLAGSPVAYTVMVNMMMIVDLSNTLTPAEPAIPDAGVNIDAVVAAGNFGRLVGTTLTWWQVSFTRPVDLNENTFYIDSGGNQNRNASGAISGNGVVVFRNTGPLPGRVVAGNIGNTYTGTTTVSGIVSLAKSSGNALCGPITLNNSSANLVWTASNQIEDTANLTLTTSGASLNLPGYKDTINELYLVTGTAVQTGAGGILKVARLFINGTQQDEVAKIAGDGYVLGSGWIEVGASGPPVIGTVPAEPATPVPTDWATTVHPANLPKLDWADSSLAVSYDVYLWLETDTQPTTPTATDVLLSEYTVSPQVLSLSTYKWQVVAKNSVGPTVGPVWTFSTVDRTLVAGNAGQNQTDFNSNLNYIVGVGNSAKLLGNFTVAWWGTGGSFSVPVDTNGFILDANTGGGNGGHNASGPISGSGSFVITHGPAGDAWDNIYTISGATANTYTGPTEIKRGHILMTKTAGIDALPAGTVPIILGMAGDTARLYWGANNQINDAASITVLLPTVSVAAPDANLNFLDLAGFSDTIAALILPDDGTKTQVRTGTVTGGVLTVGSLTVNGTVMDPGTYTASNSTFVFGLGSVVVSGGTGSPFDTWAATYAGSGMAGEDYNNDGVQNGVAFFMGMNGLATNPGIVNGKVTWDHVGVVTSFEVQVSVNLIDWEPAATGDVEISSTQVIYTLPPGPPSKFCRLVVTP